MVSNLSIASASYLEVCFGILKKICNPSGIREISWLDYIQYLASTLLYLEL